MFKLPEMPSFINPGNDYQAKQMSTKARGGIIFFGEKKKESNLFLNEVRVHFRKF